MNDARHFDYGLIDDDLILQSLSDGVCVVNADRSLAFANRSAAKLLRYPPEAMIGRNYDVILFNRDKTSLPDELAICPVQFALTDGASSHINSEIFHRADGETLLVEYVCSPIVRDGRTIGAVLTFQDISERRDIEIAVSNARDAAFEAARAKAAFLANMSHEIRTPLSGIVGTASLLAETELDEKQRRFLLTLQKSVDVLLETVNDILDFSKIEAGKLKLDTVAFHLHDLIAEIVGLFRISAERKGVSLDFEIEPAVGDEFLGDVNRLRQVLNNLLSNAVKFTAAGTVRLRVSASSEQIAERRVLFEVTDTGIGIDESHRARLFEPFEQADLSTTSRFGGTGLGLAICREIVELMNGEIGVESRPGNGSRFWFTVVLTPYISRPRLSEVKPDAFSEARHGESDLRILVVDDDEVNREVTGELLRHIGYFPEFAANGAEAIDISARRDFDLILMDLQMPEIDGFAAVEMIRASDRNASAKIVALTAFSAETERERCRRAGIDGYQCKPVTKNDLTSLIGRLFAVSSDAPNLDLNENFGHHSLAEIINPEILRSFLAIEARGEKNFVQEIFDIFCVNAENQLLTLKEEIHKRDSSAVKRRAHSLKGSSANVGLVKLTALFDELQTMADRANWSETGQLFAATAAEFEFVKKKVQEV